AFLTQATFYVHDGYAPVMGTITGSKGDDGLWHGNGQIGPFTVAATDKGLGMSEVDLDGGNVHQTKSNSCTGVTGVNHQTDCAMAVPSGFDTTFTYNTADLS